jgi:flagellar hook-basal body complex protein FliE
MIIPPLGGLAGGLEGLGATGASATGALPGASSPATGLGQAAGIGAPEPTSGGTSSFGGALTQAISSLEGSQQSADAASQALATGNVKDPEAAIATVEDAALTMQLAAQIRTKAVEATQTIFQTQV